jgi:predicted amidohydrolase
MRDLTITLLQAELDWHAPESNRGRFEQLIAASSDVSDLIILPEMFTTGFTMEASENAETMDGDTVAWMANVAGQEQVTLCGSIIIEVSGHFYNRLIWMPPDGQLASYDKRHLFRMADEHQHYTAGQQRTLVQLGEWRICPMVCYDLRFPAWSRGRNEFDLLIYVANWPSARRSAWRVLLPARAVENQCYVAGVNRVGEDGNGVAYAGDSMVADYLGSLVTDCENRPCSTTVSLDLDALIRYREKFPAFLDGDEFTIRD